MAQALEETSWPGRFEVVSREPFDDFGWSPQSPCYQGLVGYLERTLYGLSEGNPFTCIKTKALEDMLDLLETFARY